MLNDLNTLLARPVNNHVHAAPTLVPALPATDEQVFTDYLGSKQKAFTVENKELHSEYGKVENKRGIFVDGRCINVVSPAYEVHQPMDVFTTFKQVADTTGLEIKRVLTNPHNGGIMISAKFEGTQILGESHDINLTFYTSHSSTHITFLTLDALRIACFNQLPLLSRNRERFLFAEKHYKNALNLDVIGRSLEGIPASVEAYNQQAELLNDKTMSFASFQELFIDHYKLDTEAARFKSKMEKAAAVYRSAPGQQSIAETAYKAYQAVTYINTHEGKETKLKDERVILQGSNDSLKFLDRLIAA